MQVGHHRWSITAGGYQVGKREYRSLQRWFVCCQAKIALINAHFFKKIHQSIASRLLEFYIFVRDCDTHRWLGDCFTAHVLYDRSRQPNWCGGLVQVCGLLGTGPCKQWASERSFICACAGSNLCMKTSPLGLSWKKCLPWNRSLVPKRLETAALSRLKPLEHHHFISKRDLLTLKVWKPFSYSFLMIGNSEMSSVTH